MYDVIVIGVGTMGAATCDALSRRGARVLGLEQFTIPNDRGAHHGRSRMFRMAYYEHPDYVPLLQRSYTLWRDLERRASVRLFHEVGALYIGRRDSELVAGSLESANRHGIEHRALTRSELSKEFPQFSLPDDHVGVYEPRAGFVVPELSIQAMAAQAASNGATVLDAQQVIGWTALPGQVSVQTAAATHEARMLVITAGAWTSRLITGLGVPLVVTRQVLGWVRPRDLSPFRGRDGGSGFPCWAIGYDDGSLHYGFPIMDGETTLKIALHSRGLVADPDRLDRSLTAADEATFRSVIDRYLPGAAGPTVESCLCTYTNSPDSHFIIDKHPTHANVLFVCGFSGHGFKFAPVMGEALADLALSGRTDLPIGFLSLSRFRS